MREKAKDFIKIKVRNGQSTSFWFDNWTNMGPLIEVTGDRGRIDMGISANATVAHALNSHRRRRHRTQILNNIEDALEEARRDLDTNEEDVGLWRRKHDIYRPKFITKYTWEQLRREKPPVPWAKGIWFSRNTPKFAFHAWVAMLNRLPTGDRMQHWSASISLECVLCRQQMETRDHIYFMCSYSQQVWTNLATGLLRNDFSTEWSRIVSILTCSNRPRLEIYTIRYLFQATIYHLWRERNERRHGSPLSSPEKMIKLIDKVIKNRFSSLQLLRDARFEDGFQLWLAFRPRS